MEGPPEPGVAAPLARAEELLRQSAIGPWPPEVERLVATTGELAENAGEDWSRAAVALFDDQHAADTAFRFEESAYVFWKRDAVDDARACLAAADAFRAGDPSSNPVAGACAELLLAGALESIRARRDPEPSAEPSKAGEAG